MDLVSSLAERWVKFRLIVIVVSLVFAVVAAFFLAWSAAILLGVLMAMTILAQSEVSRLMTLGRVSRRSAGWLVRGIAILGVSMMLLVLTFFR
jgi:hypothetical protein